VGYAICTECTFLRAFSARSDYQPPATCPACGGELEVHDPMTRFPPAYLGRVSTELHAAPPLKH
jgi:hypothetical protein